MFQICALLLNFVLQNNLPFSIVRSSALKQLLEEMADRKIKMPSIKFTMQTLSSKFQIMKRNLIQELYKQSFVCLTTDVWTHRCRSYLGVSVHYIDEENIKLRKSHMLAFRRLKQRHTFDYLASALNELFDEFDLPVKKITHVVTDGGSNFCKAFRIYGSNDDFGESIAAIQEPEQLDEEDEFDEDVVVVDYNAVVILENEGSEEDSEFDDAISEEQIAKDIQNTVVEFDQINFPDEPLALFSRCDTNCGNINLPRQMRCFSHMLNLVGKISSKIIQ